MDAGMGSRVLDSAREHPAGCDSGRTYPKTWEEYTAWYQARLPRAASNGRGSRDERCGPARLLATWSLLLAQSQNVLPLGWQRK